MLHFIDCYVCADEKCHHVDKLPNDTRALQKLKLRVRNVEDNIKRMNVNLLFLHEQFENDFSK